jgi:hypothetical protein
MKADDRQGSRDWRYEGARDTLVVSAMKWAARIVAKGIADFRVFGCSSLRNANNRFRYLRKESEQSE